MLVRRMRRYRRKHRAQVKVLQLSLLFLALGVMIYLVVSDLPLSSGQILQAYH